MTCMPKRPRQSSATRRPTLPMPTMPIVRPLTSLPMKTLRSCIVPCRKAWLVWMICFESISTMASTCVAAGLVDDEHAGVGAVLDADGVEAGAVGGNDEQVRHAREQIALGMEARIELVARRSDLVGVRGRHDRPGNLVGGFVLELVEPDLRPLRDDVEVAGVRDVAHVEHALHVVLHFLKVLD